MNNQIKFFDCCGGQKVLFFLFILNQIVGFLAMMKEFIYFGKCHEGDLCLIYWTLTLCDDNERF